MGSRSRRDFLKVAAAGAAGAVLVPAAGRAAGKSITMLHESSFIPPFDEYIKNDAGAGVREADRRQGGLRDDRRRRPADPDQHGDRDRLRRGRFDDGTAAAVPLRRQADGRRATSPRRSARRRAAGTPRPRRPASVDGKWMAIPFANIGQLMVWRTDWFARGRGQEVPGDLGRVLRGRQEAEGQGPSLRLRARPRLRRQPRLALSAAVVVWRPRGRGRRQDRGHRFGRDRPRPRFLPASSSRIACSRTASAGPTSATTRRGWPSRSRAPTMPRASSGSPSASFPEIAKVTDQAHEPAGPKGRFHLLNSISHSSSTSRR